MRLSGLAARLTNLRTRIAIHLPVPLAAPESAELAAARRRVIAALLLLALTCVGAEALSALSPVIAPFLVVALLTFLAIQTPLWLRAKARADNEWLMRETMMPKRVMREIGEDKGDD